MTRRIHPHYALSILLFFCASSVPATAAVDPDAGSVRVGDALPTAAPAVIEYWNDNNPYNDDVDAQQPTPAPILWDYWPSTTYASDTASETSSGGTSNTNESDPDIPGQTPDELLDDATTKNEEDDDDDDPWLLYVILSVAGLGLIVILVGLACCYRYHSKNNLASSSSSSTTTATSQLLHRYTSSSRKTIKTEEATDRSTAEDKTEPGAYGDDSNNTATESSPDLEQPSPRECPFSINTKNPDESKCLRLVPHHNGSTSTTKDGAGADATTASISSTVDGRSTSALVASPLVHPSHHHSHKQQQQQRQYKQQRQELLVLPTLKCRKLLTVASVKAQVQQEQEHGHIINDDEDDEPGDSLAVRELKHANAVLAGQHTEL